MDQPRQPGRPLDLPLLFFLQERAQGLEQLQSGVEDFLDAHPGADMAQVTALFGTPERLPVTRRR